MEKKVYLNGMSFRKLVAFALLAIILITVGCYEWKSINQPSSAFTNSSFDVQITLQRPASEDPSADDIFGHALLGIILPDGWTVADSITFNKAGQTEEQAVVDTLVSDTTHVSALEADTMMVPEGYHWWAAKSINPVNMIGFDTAFVKITIFTDDVPGEYNLKYVIGDDEGEGPRFPYSSTVISEFMPISVDEATGVLQTWRKEEWEVYPNPSTGQIFIRQPDVTGGVAVTVMDISGKIKKRQVLTQNTTMVDLQHLPGGMYIVALEKNGNVKSKKIVIR